MFCHVIAIPGLHIHIRLNKKPDGFEVKRRIELDELVGGTGIESLMREKMQGFSCLVDNLSDEEYCALRQSGFQVEEAHSVRKDRLDNLKGIEVPPAPHVWDELENPKHLHWSIFEDVRKVMKEQGWHDLNKFLAENQDLRIFFQGQHMRIGDIEGVRYLKPAEAQRYQVFYDGDEHKWFWDNDDWVMPCDEGGKKHYEGFYTFVTDREGQMFMHSYVLGRMHHISTPAGAPVLFSGMAKIDKESTLTDLAVVSGHYHCGFEQLEYMLKHLRDQGVDCTKISVDTNSDFTGITAQERADLKQKFGLRHIF